MRAWRIAGNSTHVGDRCSLMSAAMAGLVAMCAGMREIAAVFTVIAVVSAMYRHKSLNADRFFFKIHLHQSPSM
jgi:hypothetical protein